MCNGFRLRAPIYCRISGLCVLAQRYHEGEDGKKIPIGDYDRYIECTEACARFAAWLAPYQSPKLSAVAVTKAPQQTGGTFNSE